MDTPDLLPPHSIESEKAVLGAILQNGPDGALETFQECQSLGVESSWFYDLRHGLIWSALSSLSSSGGRINPITLLEALRGSNTAQDSGGLPYIAELPDKCPGAGSVSDYVATLERRFVDRQILIARAHMERLAYDASVTSEEKVAKISGMALEMGVRRRSASTRLQLMEKFAARYDEVIKGRGKPIGLLSGISVLDAKLRGFRPGHMVVIAARPALGKTSLACQIADNIATEQKTPVGIFTFEMTDEELNERMILSRARVDSSKFENGELNQGDYKNILLSSCALTPAKIEIEFVPGMKFSVMRNHARAMVQRGVKLIVIDYLQLVGTDLRPGGTREREVAQISNGIKQMAGELNIPVLVLAQLNRETERENRRPRMSDLRESGAIEQDADKIGMLFRPTNGKETPDPDALEYAVTMQVVKHRGGPTGDVRLFFKRTITRFEVLEDRPKTHDIPSPRFTNGHAGYHNHPDA